MNNTTILSPTITSNIFQAINKQITLKKLYSFGLISADTYKQFTGETIKQDNKVELKIPMRIIK